MFSVNPSPHSTSLQKMLSLEPDRETATENLGFKNYKVFFCYFNVEWVIFSTVGLNQYFQHKSMP